MEMDNITPHGAYTDDFNFFPNSVVPVPTAIPAFIGYTPKASDGGKSYLNVPIKVTSYSEFKAIFCFPDPAPPANPVKQYSPEYYLVQQKTKPEQGDFLMIGSTYYSIVPDPNTIYYLYNSIRLFYENGGGVAYIVSVGTYGTASNKPMDPGEQIVNPNVQLKDLLGGLALLKNVNEPTMYVVPEATLLTPANNQTLMEAMLLQNSEMETAISILDIIGGRNPDPILFTNDIQNFRNSTGNKGLDFGAAYYPFIGTSLMQSSDLDYTNLFGGDIKQLASLLNPPEAPNPAVAAILEKIENPGNPPLSVTQNNNALILASKTYSTIINQLLTVVNILPPSGAMAGVITVNDSQIGVWNAPANTSIVGAVSLPLNLSSSQQADLNVDAVSGKSINAIRYFNGMGILIWGARTLDGNSMDWKYLSVRRTIIYIEQSCKLATQPFVFAPNDKNTWESVKSMIESFLSSIWNAGGLQGASASDAFSVQVGLGSTMTQEDILKGIMRVTIKVAVVRLAEYIILTFEQEMDQSS